MSRRRRIRNLILGVLLFAAVALIYASWPGRSTFTVSPETTYVIGPLDKHGYIDYVTALNERLSKGTTPENNANVLIWKALGPHPEGAGNMPEEYFKWLGINPPPEQGDYVIRYADYLKEKFPDEERQKRNHLNDQMPARTKAPWVAKDDPLVADWLQRNEKPLAIAMEASRRPDYWNPLVPRRTDEESSGLIGALLPNVQLCREIAAMLCVRAMLRVGEGKIDAAWQDLLACHRLGRLLARGGIIIEMLVGVAIDRVASASELVFLDRAHLDSRRVRDCLRDLQVLPPMPAVAERLDLGERFFFLDAMMLVVGQGSESIESTGSATKRRTFWDRLFTRSINWDRALRYGNRIYDRCAAGARLPDRAAREKEMADIEREITSARKRFEDFGALQVPFLGPKGRGEMIGYTLIGLLLPAFDKIQAAADRSEQTQRNLHLAFALAAYQRDHGRYPAKLDELSPKYLETIPDDLFSGKPLIYRLEEKGYLLYSVGQNGMDEEGRGTDDEPRGDDLSVRMPVPEPRGKDE